MPFLSISHSKQQQQQQNPSGDEVSASSAKHGASKKHRKLTKLFRKGKPMFGKRTQKNSDGGSNSSRSSSRSNLSGSISDSEDEASISMVFDLPSQMETPSGITPASTTISLGTGSFSTIDGVDSISASLTNNDNNNDSAHVVNFNSSVVGNAIIDHTVDHTMDHTVNETMDNSCARAASATSQDPSLQVDMENGTYFIRAGDLALDKFAGTAQASLQRQGQHSTSFSTTHGPPALMASSLSLDDSSDINDGHASDLLEYYRQPSHNPPTPGTESSKSGSAKSQESWVALNMTSGGTGDASPTSSPMADIALPNLKQHALDLAFDETRWIAESKTKTLLAKSGGNSWHHHTFSHKSIPPSNTDSNTSDVLVWTTGSTFGDANAQHFGHDVPAIRSAAMISMSCKDLYDLLLDSSRIQDYNKFSLGRTDLLVLNGNTKITHAKSKPPVVRKPIELTNVMYSESIDNGYIIVSRTVQCRDEQTSAARGENIMTVHLIQNVSKDGAQCMLVNINHLTPPPFIPQMVARRVGLMAAANFMHDLQSLPATST